MVRCYWNNPEKTASTFVQGWMDTGDTMFRDHNGLKPATQNVRRRRLAAGQGSPKALEIHFRYHPGAHLASQNDQLTAERRILSFKPALRLEWYGQESKKYTHQPEHGVSIGDSITPSTQIRFSVHTTVSR
jgi:hypothetical protein